MTPDTPEVEKPDVKEVTIKVKGVDFNVVYVEGGTFLMGATDEMSNPNEDEKPVRQVTLSSYYIGQTEVTQALWTAVMGSNPSLSVGDDLPVEQVTWNDCQKFIQKLNSLTDKHFRLPTEAEWEYAARGGKKSRGYQYSGSKNLPDVAWFKTNSVDKTHPVGTKLFNELALYDMSGNVWEWCQDWYGDYSSTSQMNPKGPSSGTRRVIRGGSWTAYPRECRSSYRGTDKPDSMYKNLGLRLALSE